MRSRRHRRISAPAVPLVCGICAAEEIRACCPVKKERLTLQVEVATIVLLVIHRRVRLAIEELAVEIHPRKRVRRHQRSGVSARAVSAIRCQEVRQIKRLPEYGHLRIAVVDAAALIQRLIVFEPRAALFQRCVEALQLETDAGAEVDGAVVE